MHIFLTNQLAWKQTSPSFFYKEDDLFDKIQRTNSKSINTMLSTLSTGLNKSEEFIRTNASKIHIHDLTFNNNEKFILTEDTRIPHGENNIKCYL